MVLIFKLLLGGRFVRVHILISQSDDRETLTQKYMRGLAMDRIRKITYTLSLSPSFYMGQDAGNVASDFWPCSRLWSTFLQFQNEEMSET